MGRLWTCSKCVDATWYSRKQVGNLAFCQQNRVLPDFKGRFKQREAVYGRTLHMTKEYNLQLKIESIEDMEDVGALLSISSSVGDVLTLDGDLGAGKTCFSRGFVRAKTGNMSLKVTSPTYLLSNTYSVPEEELVIHHMDLYRLSEGKDLSPLNLPHVFTKCVSLIEWPTRLGELIPQERLDVNIQTTRWEQNELGLEESTRLLTLTPHGKKWIERIQFLETEGYLDDLMTEFEENLQTK